MTTTNTLRAFPEGNTFDCRYYGPGAFVPGNCIPQDAPKEKVIFWRVDDAGLNRVAQVARFKDGDSIYYDCDQHPGQGECEHSHVVEHSIETGDYRRPRYIPEDWA